MLYTSEFYIEGKGKGKTIPIQVWKKMFQEFLDNMYMKVVRLSPPRTGYLYTLETPLVFIY